jgi:hypothetical protein
VRRLLATVFLALALPAVTGATVHARSLRVVAWAATTTKAGLPPADAVAGGTYCKPRAIPRLYAFVRFTGMRDKVPSSATWLFNGKKVFVFTFRWEDGDVGRTAFNLYRTKGGLAEGVYTIQVRTGGVLVGSGAVRLKFGSC